MTQFILNHFIPYLIECFIFYFYVSKTFTRKNKSIYPILLFIGSFSLVSMIVSCANVFWLNTLIFAATSFLLIYFFYDVTLANSIFQALVITILMALAELIPYNIINMFTSNIYVDNYFLLALTICSKCLYFLFLQILNLISAKNDHLNFKFNFGSIILIGYSAISFAIIMICFYINIVYGYYRSIFWLVAIISILVLLLIFLANFLYYYFQKTSREYTLMSLHLQKEKVDSEYNLLLLEQNEKMHLLVHDIKDHLLSIEALNNEHNNSKVTDYIKKLLNMPVLHCTTNFCDNKLLNSILHRYEQLCSDNEVSFHADIRKNTLTFISSNDLTTIFCNILNNAVESVRDLNNAFIDLNVSNPENTSLTLITLVNSCRKNPFNNAYELITTKIDSQNHGFGLKSITKAIKKYQGSIKTYFNDEDNTFHTIIAVSNQINN